MSDLIPINKRRINVVNVGGKNFTMESGASNRGELEAEIRTMNMNVSFNQKKVIIGETKNTLDVPGALLPSSNFTLFIMPSKTKAGGEVRNKVKELMQKYPVEAKAHFSAEKSYTVSKETELEALLKTWKEPDEAAEVPAPKSKEKKPKAEPKPKAGKSTTVGEVVDSVVEHKKKEQIDMDLLKSIYTTVADNSSKLDQLLAIAGSSLGAKTLAKSPQIAAGTNYSEAVHELQNGEIDTVKREIEREFPDVKNY